MAGSNIAMIHCREAWVYVQSRKRRRQSPNSWSVSVVCGWDGVCVQWAFWSWYLHQQIAVQAQLEIAAWFLNSETIVLWGDASGFDGGREPTRALCLTHYTRNGQVMLIAQLCRHPQQNPNSWLSIYMTLVAISTDAQNYIREILEIVCFHTANMMYKTSQLGRKQWGSWTEIPSHH
jgi:hypothetical protein